MYICICIYVYMYIYTYFPIKVIMHSINITLLMKTDTWTDIYPPLKYEQS